MFTIKRLGNSLLPGEKSFHGVNPESDDVPEQFKCPICFEVPESNVYQCTQGHIICSKCQSSVRLCPQCRTALTSDRSGTLIRNRALESLLDSIVFSCPYLTKGCTETVARANFKQHVINCVYNGKCIQLCQHMGLNCDFWTKTLKPGDAAWHFRSSHETTLHNSSSVRIIFVNFQDVHQELLRKSLLENQSTGSETEIRIPDFCNGMWAPILLKSYNTYFLIVSLLNRSDTTMSFMCFHLDLSLDPTQFEVQIIIQTSSEDIVDNVKLKIPVVPVLKVAPLLKIPPLRVPYEFLREHYLDESGSLITEVAVTRASLINEEQCQNQATTPEVTYNVDTIILRR